MKAAPVCSDKGSLPAGRPSPNSSAWTAWLWVGGRNSLDRAGLLISSFMAWPGPIGVVGLPSHRS